MVSVKGQQLTLISRVDLAGFNLEIRNAGARVLVKTVQRDRNSVQLDWNMLSCVFCVWTSLGQRRLSCEAHKSLVAHLCNQRVVALTRWILKI